MLFSGGTSQDYKGKHRRHRRIDSPSSTCLTRTKLRHTCERALNDELESEKRVLTQCLWRRPGRAAQKRAENAQAQHSKSVAGSKSRTSCLLRIDVILGGNATKLSTGRFCGTRTGASAEARRQGSATLCPSEHSTASKCSLSSLIYTPRDSSFDEHAPRRHLH